jgi:ribonuclease J
MNPDTTNNPIKPVGEIKSDIRDDAGTVRPPAHRGSTGAPRSGFDRGSRPSGPRPPRGGFGRRPSAPALRPRKAIDVIPPAGDNIRIIPLGGVEEIGKNMTLIEYKDDIIVIDMGFQFKEDDTPGADYILPNTKYLEDRKDKIRGVFITHGHLDHIGGIPYIMDRIGNPPIYTRALTSILIKKRQDEFPHLPPLDIRIVEKEDKITVGNLKVRFFAVSHTVPDSMGIIVETPYGILVTPGDIKLDHDDGIPTEKEQKEFSKFDNENVLFLMMDSTNVDNPGFSTPERLVHKNLEEIIKHRAPGYRYICQSARTYHQDH